MTENEQKFIWLENDLSSLSKDLADCKADNMRLEDKVFDLEKKIEYLLEKFSQLNPIKD